MCHASIRIPFDPVVQQCQCLRPCYLSWIVSGWTCPTAAPRPEDSCGHSCKCQRAWRTSGWICCKNMEKGFVFVREQDSTMSPPGSVGVVNAMTGNLILYILPGRPFTHADVTDCLSHLCIKFHFFCRLRFCGGCGN